MPFWRVTQAPRSSAAAAAPCPSICRKCAPRWKSGPVARARRSTRSPTRSARFPRRPTAPATMSRPPDGRAADGRDGSGELTHLPRETHRRCRAITSKQCHLIPPRQRHLEEIAAQIALPRIQPHPPRRQIEPPCDHAGKHPLAAHPPMPVGGIILAAMHLAQPVHHPPRAVRVMRGQPLLKQPRHLARQPQHDPACGPGPGLARRPQNRLDLVIAQPRHDRRHHHPHRHPGVAQPPDHRQTPRRRRRARLQQPRQPVIERGDRNPHLRQPPRRHVRQDIQIPLDQRALGHNRHRMVEPRQHLQTAPGDRILPLHWLIGIGVGADGDRRHPVAARAQLRLQPRRGLGPRDQPGLEIKAGRQPQIGMAGPRKAVDTAMLTTAIGIDRPVKRQVGRAVVTDDPARPLLRDLRAQHPRLLLAVPAICLVVHAMRLEPARRVAHGTARPQAQIMGHGRILGHGRKYGTYREHLQQSDNDHANNSVTSRANPGYRSVAARPASQFGKWRCDKLTKAAPDLTKMRARRASKDSPMSDEEDDIILSELDDEELVQQMFDDLYDGLKEEIEEGVNILLERGWQPYQILTEALVGGMTIVGKDFRDGILFVPEVLLAANAMKGGMAILKPLLAETGAPRVGKMVIGTVKGDIHDIGKNLVSMMMEGAGFDVVDLGINNAVDAYLDALEVEQPDILGMSALLTTTMPYMKVVIDAMVERGVRDRHIVLVGGAPLNEEFGRAIGADAYCRDAAVAVETAKALVAARKHNQMAAVG